MYTKLPKTHSPFGVYKLYMVSEWFNTCARIYTIIGEKLIFLYMDLLGIDKAQKVKNPNRNWYGIRNFFKAETEHMT